MKLYQMSDPVRFPRMTTDELRRTFPLEDLFVPDSVTWAYVDLDRAVIGGVIPRREALRLGNHPELRAELFLERREVGVLKIGGPGSVMADGKTFDMEKLDCVYIGRGTREVSFTSKDASTPAVFYLLSYPAHAAFPAAQKRFVDLEPVELGSLETCNQRMLYKAIYQGGLPSCQLVLGFTLLQPGSNWNTMPPHTHMRRSEVYL